MYSPTVHISKFWQHIYFQGFCYVEYHLITFQKCSSLSFRLHWEVMTNFEYLQYPIFAGRCGQLLHTWVVSPILSQKSSHCSLKNSFSPALQFLSFKMVWWSLLEQKIGLTILQPLEKDCEQQLILSLRASLMHLATQSSLWSSGYSSGLPVNNDD